MKSGIIDSGSLEEARRKLRDQGLFVLQIALGEQHASSGKSFANFSATHKVRKADLLMFTTQLSIMCRSGIDLAEALQSAAKQCTSPALKLSLDEIYADVSEGKSISFALEKHSHIFGDAYVASITAGEQSGTLVEILQRLAELLRNEIRLWNSVKSVISYPLVLMSVAMLVLGALVFFVLPQFASVFQDIGKEPPPLTQFILAGGSLIRENLLYLSIGGVLTAIGLFRFWLTDTAQHLWDSFIMNGMMIRNATRPLLTGRTFRLLGTMLQSGIPLLEAIRLCRSSVKNHLFQKMYDALEDDILSGNGIGKALSRFDFVPAGAAQMVMTAEQTGKLGEVSQTIGEYYEDDGEEKIRQLSKLLEPAIIVVMGAVVAFVMLAIMLPLLDVSTMSS